jgi:hypothetical protein|tara:strand:- start:2779 stop:3333 length:555 start_codon:yes stop_codon:yes gene_type:complete
MNSDNNNSVNLLMITSVIGIFILVLPISTGSIYGYGLTLFSILGIMSLFIISNINNTNTQENLQMYKKIFKALLKHDVLPIILIVLILAWLFSLNIKYYDKFIEPNMLPNEFIRFKNLTTALLFIAIILINSMKYIFYNNQIVEDQEKNVKKSQNRYILYLLVTILAVMTGLMQVILQYYLTDG